MGRYEFLRYRFTYFYRSFQSIYYEILLPIDPTELIKAKNSQVYSEV